jgi:hypothetical protein
MLGIPLRTLALVGAGGLAVLYLSGTVGPLDPARAAHVNPCQMTVTADILKVRSAPHQHAAVVAKYRHGATLGSSPVVINGYRRLTDTRWAAAEFLQPPPGSVCT